jgi:3-deoxy-7-phosphoheptulonate synthase
MIRFESNLKGGKQSSEQPRENLEYGVSITDGALRHGQELFCS